MSQGLVYFIWYSLHFLDLSEWFLSHVREVFDYYLLEYFFCPLISLFSCWHPYNMDIGAFNIVPEFSETPFICFQFFSLFCSASVISTNLSSTLLICSSASYILLLAASSEFFISVIVFCISSCLSFFFFLSFCLLLLLLLFCYFLGRSRGIWRFPG